MLLPGVELADHDIVYDIAPVVVVPGHGEVSGVLLIRDVRDHLACVRAEASRLWAAGASADEAAAAIGRLRRPLPRDSQSGGQAAGVGESR